MDLKKNAPKGEFLAYINKEEAAMLKKAGGSGKLVNGIPSFRPQDMGNKENQAVSANNPGIGGLGAGRTDGGDHTGDYSSKTAAKEKAKYEKQFGGVSPTGSRPRSFFDRIKTYNNNFQKKQNIKLAQRRAFQKYQDIEKYADIMDDYGLTAEKIAEKVAANNTYGYDFSDLDPGKKTLGSNIGTSIEKYRENLYDVNPKTKYGVMQALLDATRKDTQVTAENTLNKARDYNTLAVDPNISREKLEALANRGKTLEQINPPSGGNNNQPYLPFDYNTGAATTEAVEPYTNDFTYRFGGDQDVIYDDYGTSGYRTTAAEGGIMGLRARRAFGGIMDRVTGRKAYGLGSVFKSITKPFKSVAKAAGKVLKSDVGKMALFAAGTYYAGGGFGRLTDGFKFGNIPGAGYLMGGGKTPAGNFNPFKVAGLGLGALALFGNKAKPNEDIGMGDRGGRLKDSQGNDALPADIRAEIREAYASGDSDRIKAMNNYYNFLPGADAVKLPSVQPYLPFPNYAEGGRIGKAEGGLMDLGGMEKDYRAEGGFVPIGEYEKKDDVPARLSVNEFVFTADAVRGAGQGDIDKGAEIMENMMENLENGGTVSEESQGNKGAQNMFKTSERLGAVI